MAAIAALLVIATLMVAILLSSGPAQAQDSTPDAPTGLRVTSSTHDRVTLTWNDPGDSSITGHQILRRSGDGDEYGDGQGAPEFVAVTGNTGITATIHTDAGLDPRTRYVYRVKARNAAGLGPWSSYANAETEAAPTQTQTPTPTPTPPVPGAPTGLTATSVSFHSVALNWDDPGDGSITGYRVIRRSRDGNEYGDGRGAAEFVPVVNDTGSSATSYTDTSATARTRYVYRIQAQNPAGLSAVSTYVNAETLEAPPLPTAPTGLTAASVAQDSVTLVWDDPGDDTITGHQILRRSRDGDEYGEGQGAPEFVAVTGNTGSPAATHTDASVAPRTRYVYRIRVRSSQGLSEGSNDANAETPEAPPDPPLSSGRGSRPNIVLILADDLGWGHIQSNNPDSAMTTPRIDSIAAAGAKFTDAHSPSSACTGTRYGLLTGRYSWRSWLTHGVVNAFDRPLIGPDRPTLGTLLQGHGYRTAVVGKWHLGMDFGRLSDVDEVDGLNKGVDFSADIVDGAINHGFDEFFGTGGNLSFSFPPVYIRDNRFTATPVAIGPVVRGNIEFHQVLDRLTGEAVSFIERAGEAEEPFFLYLPLNAPHEPIAPNEEFDGLTGLGDYADIVAQVDWSVGEVLDAIHRVGASDNTLVIFTSDNGSFKGRIRVPNHVDHRSNGSWKHGKGSIYEGGHRIPLVLQWPAVVRAGSAIDATVSLTDMYATLSDILVEEPASGVAPDSVSLLPILLGEAETRGEPVVHHSTHGIFALRDGRWKLVFTNALQLYDLEQDPGESRNVAGANREVVKRLEATLADIRSAEDGTRSGDATLRRLRLDGIDIGLFDPGVRNYAAFVRPGIETVEVTALPTVTDARVSISTPEGRLLYGRPQRGRVQVELANPTTTIVANVLSPDESATTTYTVTLTRSDVTIIGAAVVGETLTVDTPGIPDPDGLNNLGNTYQWIRSDGSTDVDIVGATGAAYVLAVEDEGRSILVRVSFTDGGGSVQKRTSAPTTAVEVALTAEFQQLPDSHDGYGTFTFRVLFSEPVYAGYRTLRDHSSEVSSGNVVEARRVDGRNDLWEIEVQPHRHVSVVITLPPTENCAAQGAICTSDGKRLITRLQIPVAPQGAPTIGGRAEVGETLTAYTSGIFDADGLTDAVFGYQWVSYDGNTDADIPDATEATYTLVSADEGNSFRVRVSFTDDAGNEETRTSALARSERPYGLAATESDGAVVLTWELPAGWPNSGSFQILRYRPELGETEPLVHVRFTEPGITTYTDMDVEPGVLYVYRVKKVDPFGYTGEASQPVEIRTAAPGSLPARPNIVLILADDLGWGDIQSNNPDSAMTTPRIDSIAAAGAKFTDAHSPSSMCAPTRYGLLTGRYAWRSWLLYRNIDPFDRPLIGSDRPTLGTLLQGHGYRTAVVGKWHLGMELPLLTDVEQVNSVNKGVDFSAEIIDSPVDHGFDEFFGLSANLRSSPPAYIRDNRFLANPDLEDQPAPGKIVKNEVLDRLTEESVAFIERSAQTDDPFLLYLPLNAPHRSYVPNDDFLGSTGLGSYADFIAQVDWSVGQVLDALEQADALNGTLVIFASDNGAELATVPIPNHADHRSNGPWRGGKGTILEGGHRVPFMMQWPSSIEAGSSVTSTVSLVDLYATLADIVGDEPNPGVAADSESLLPLLQGEAATRAKPVVHYSSNGMFAIRDGNLKLIFGRGDGGLVGVSPPPFSQPWQLYDLENDPREKESRYSGTYGHSELITRMVNKLHEVRSSEDDIRSSDATLRFLTVAGADIGTFDSGDSTYRAFVDRDVGSVIISAIPAVVDAQVRIPGAAMRTETSGRGVVQLAGPGSSTAIEVAVTAPDGESTKIYTVRVTRLGQPTITGNTQVPGTLTADVAPVAGLTSLHDLDFTYQWVRVDGNAESDIAGATSSTYTLQEADVGKVIKVRVSFTDDGANSITVISVPTDAVRGEERVADVVRDLRVTTRDSGELSVAWREPSGDGGSEITGYVVQWKKSSGRWGIATEVFETTVTGRTNLITGLMDDMEYDVRVRAVNAVGVGAEVEATAIPVDPPLTASFTGMPGTHNGGDAFWIFIAFSEEIATTGETFRDHALAVAGGEVVSADAFGASDLWVVSVDPHGNGDVTIALPATTNCDDRGAICADDEKRLSTHIVYTVSGPEDSNSPATGVPTISGTAQVGQTLTADTLGISDSDGTDNASFTHQWLADDSDISSATGSSYTLTSSDEGKAIKVRVSFTDDAGNDEALTSAATAPVDARPNSPAIGQPTVTGIAAVGNILGVGITAVSDQNGLTQAAYSYQWFRASSAISGATDSTYTVVRADAGASIKVAVSFTDDDGYDETAASEAVSVPLPPLTAELISTSNTPVNHDGSSAFTIRLDFSENLSISYKTVRDHALEVSNARVTNAARVNRHGDERDRRWSMTIEPANTSDIEIWIRATTDCSANGAICTPDGRKLSGGLTMTIEGP